MSSAATTEADILKALKDFAERIASQLRTAAEQPQSTGAKRSNVLQLILDALTPSATTQGSSQTLLLAQALDAASVTSAIASVRADVEDRITRISNALQTKADQEAQSAMDAEDERIVATVSNKLQELLELVQAVDENNLTQINDNIGKITEFATNMELKQQQTSASYEDMRNARFTQSVYQW